MEVDLKTNGLVWDDDCFAVYHLRKEDFAGTFDAWSRTIHPQDLDAAVQAFQNAVAGTSKYDTDRMIGTNWDNTEQKVNEPALQSSVQEQSALREEVHHRVKNTV